MDTFLNAISASTLTLSPCFRWQEQQTLRRAAIHLEHEGAAGHGLRDQPHRLRRHQGAGLQVRAREDVIQLNYGCGENNSHADIFIMTLRL